MSKIVKAIVSFILDFIETIVIALVIFVVVYLFLFQPHQVKGSSMLPSFENGEYLLTNKIVYRLDKPQRYDVVVFKAPKNEDFDYIKRIVALPGDTIKIENGNIFVNGKLLDESKYLPAEEETPSGQFLEEGQEITIPPASYFVVGDNRSHSSDSRDWGFVPLKNIVGLAWFRYWPPEKVGLLPRNLP